MKGVSLRRFQTRGGISNCNRGPIGQRELRLLLFRGQHTKRILDSSVEGTAGPEVIRIMHKKAIYFLVRGMRHHEQFHIILQLSSRSIRTMKQT